MDQYLYQDQPFPARVLSGYTTSGGIHLYSWSEVSRNLITGHWNLSGTPMPRFGVGNLTEINNASGKFDASGNFSAPFYADIRREGYSQLSSPLSGYLLSGSSLPNAMYVFTLGGGGATGISFTWSGAYVTSVQCNSSGITYNTAEIFLQWVNGLLVSGFVSG